MSDFYVQVRVPVDSFDAFMEDLQGIGVITNRNIHTTDITQQMTDVESRIAALELLLGRLQKIAEKANTVQDMLDVERELNRVIGELERLKRDMKNYTLQTDYSTVNINYSAQVLSPEVMKEIPVKWMNQYGINLLANGWLDRGGDQWKPYKITLPENFMITGSRSNEHETFQTAVSPAGEVIRISSHENNKGGTLEFFEGLARRYFTDYQNFTMESYGLESIGEKRQAIVMNAKRNTGNQNLCYYWVCFLDMDEWMVSGSGKVYCFEYQNDDPESFAEMLPEIKKCLQTLDLSLWR